MAAGDSRAEQTVLSEKRVKRKVIETQCAMRAVLLPEVLWGEGETPRFSEVSCSQLCLQCCGFESWEVDALSCVHVTQSICRPTSAPSEQCDSHLTSAQCEQTDQPLGDTAKTVSYSILQPRRHLQGIQTFNQIPHISPKDWRLPDFLSLHLSLKILK